MGKPAHTFLTGTLTFLGSMMILAGFIAAFALFMNNPAGDLWLPIAYALGGLWFGTQQIALAEIINQLRNR